LRIHWNGATAADLAALSRALGQPHNKFYFYLLDRLS
jgi:hypothetical protein